MSPMLNESTSTLYTREPVEWSYSSGNFFVENIVLDVGLSLFIEIDVTTCDKH